MGSSIAKLFVGLLGKLGVYMPVIGMVAAGETTVLYKMELGEVAMTIPAIGFNVESAKFKKRNIC